VVIVGNPCVPAGATESPRLAANTP
jgi:hypothetical protein